MSDFSKIHYFQRIQHSSVNIFEESEEHRAKRQIQTRMLLKAGIMGRAPPVERKEDIMTDPDDYFLLPPRDDSDKFVEGGDIWEIDNKY